MKLLLDTQTVLWFMDDSPRLSAAAASTIESLDNEVLLSAVVPWEISIKRALGKLSVTDRYLDMVSDAGAKALPISINHARAVESLPPIHQDPFDRLLIAQAQTEDAILVTDDPRIREYSIKTLW